MMVIVIIVAIFFFGLIVGSESERRYSAKKISGLEASYEIEKSEKMRFEDQVKDLKKELESKNTSSSLGRLRQNDPSIVIPPPDPVKPGPVQETPPDPIKPGPAQEPTEEEKTDTKPTAGKSGDS
jgi:hypothetical protein